MNYLEKEKELARGVNVSVTNYRIMRELQGPVHDEYEEIPLSSVDSIHFSQSKRVPLLVVSILFFLTAVLFMLLDVYPLVPTSALGLAIIFFVIFIYSGTPRIIVRTTTQLFLYAGPEAKDILLAINQAIYDDKPKKTKD